MVRLYEIEKPEESIETKTLKLLDKFFYYQREDIEILADGTVNCLKNITGKTRKKIETLPVKFGEVKGLFDIRNMGLKSLINSPHTVNNFWATSNKLESLEGGPKIAISYLCDFNLLKDLVGSPEKVTRTYRCFDNPLQSYEGLTPGVNRFECSYSYSLPILRLLTSKNIELYGSKNSPNKGRKKVEEILNKYCSNDSSGLRSRIIACQKELIDAGFEEIAKW